MGEEAIRDEEWRLTEDGDGEEVNEHILDRLIVPEEAHRKVGKDDKRENSTSHSVRSRALGEELPDLMSRTSRGTEDGRLLQDPSLHHWSQSVYFCA